MVRIPCCGETALHKNKNKNKAIAANSFASLSCFILSQFVVSNKVTKIVAFVSK